MRMDSLGKTQGSWCLEVRMQWLRKNGNRNPALYQSTNSPSLQLPPNPGTSPPLKGMPDSARLRVLPMDMCRWWWLDQLSPVQWAECFWPPVYPDRDSKKG